MRKIILIGIIASSFLLTNGWAAEAPGEAYLAQTMECRFTPELTALAESLDHDPVSIYNWVYENVAYEDYRCSRKGARSTYLSRRGNEWDQSSLLITLLRISGIHARYRQIGGDARVIVEAWLPTANYRGMPFGDEKDWIPLIPWLKNTRKTAGIDLFENDVIPPALAFDFDGYLTQHRQKTAIELFQESVRDYLAANYPDKTIKDVPARETLIQRPLAVLPSSLPLAIDRVAESAYYDAVPESERESITLYIKNEAGGAVLLEREIYLPEVAGRRFTLEFNQGAAGWLIPVFKLDDEIIQEGAAILADANFFPAFESDWYAYTARPSKNAGTYMLMAFDPLSASENDVEMLKDELGQLSASMVLDPATRGQYLGRIASVIMNTYLIRYLQNTNAAADLLHLGLIYAGQCPTFIYTSTDNLPTVSDAKFIVHPQWSFDSFFASVKAYHADDPLRTLIDNSSPMAELLCKLYMFSASYNEGRIFEDWQDTKALSTIRGIMAAHEQGIPVVDLTAADIVNDTIPVLANQSTNKLPDGVIAGMVDELQEGQEIKTPVQSIGFEDINGYVYLSYGPTYSSYVFNGDMGAKAVLNALESVRTALKGELPPDLQAIYDKYKGKDSNGAEVIQNSKADENKSFAGAIASFIGDPIDMVTGEFYAEEQPDINIRGRGLPLNVTRKYRSQLLYNGPFGYGWTWNHSDELIVYDGGDVVYNNTDGKHIYVSYDATEGYQYPPGMTFTLVQTAIGYEIHNKDLSKIYFDANGRLVSKADPDGNTLSFAYDAEGHLSTITDDLGRSLTFIVGANGKITRVTDFTGRYCEYAYSGDDLISFTDLEGNTTTFEYYADLDNPQNLHNLTKYILPTGDYLEIGYYKNDQVAFHRNKKGEVFNFQYSRLNKYGETWNEEGYYRKVFFNDQNDVIRITNEDKTLETMTYDTNHNKLTHTDANGHTTTFTYDDKRNLTSKTNALNEAWAYVYSNPLVNKPTAVTDPRGNTTQYEYNAQGRVTKKTDALLNETDFNYDQYGNLVQVTDALNHWEAFVYDANGLHLVSSLDKNGNETHFAHDAIGRVVSATDSQGHATQFAFNAYDQKTVVTDALGNQTSITYNAVRQPVSQTDARGGVTRIIYDTARDIVTGAKVKEKIDPLGYREYFYHDRVGNLVWQEDKKGNIHTFVYDGLGRRTETIDPFKNVVRDRYDGSGNRVESIDKRGFVTGYAFDAENRPTSVTDPLGNTVTNTYDANGNLSTVTDANGIVTRLEYDALNRMVQKTLAYGSADAAVFQYEYDALGRLTKTTNPLGHYETYGYDANGNRVSIAKYQSDGSLLATQAFEYDARNLPFEETGPTGSATTYEYDAMGRKTAMIDPAGNRTEYAYNETGNLVAVTDPLFNIIKHEYDLRGQRVLTIDAEGGETAYRYDGNGNLVWQRDADGNETGIFYDALNRKIGIRDAVGAETSFDYDPAGNLIAQNDANGGVTRFEYDAVGRKVKTIRPMGEAFSTEYDAAGNKTAVIDAMGQKTAYNYNDLYQIETVSYYAAADWVTPVKTVSFTYDEMGSLLSYDDGTTSALYGYDALGRKTAESVDYGPFALNHSVTYRADGQKASYTGPDNATVSYGYDAYDRLTDINLPGGAQVSYANFEWNRPTTVAMPGGVTTTYAYTAKQQVAAITTTDGAASTIFSRHYEYSPAGNITAKHSEHGTYTYQYDAVNQLTQANNPTLSGEAYGYDLLGNRMSTATASGFTYDLNNRLLAHDGTTFDYDLNGNTTSKTTGGVFTRFYYDTSDRLARVADSGGGTIAEYSYDPFGRRLWKDVGGTRTYFFYTDEGLSCEYGVTGQELRTYGYRPNPGWTTAPVYMIEAGVYYYYLNDHLGTPQKVVDSAGGVAWEAIFESFGVAHVAGGAVVINNVRFPGQYYDAETELYYNWNRYYDQKIGRYLRSDPAEDGVNLYLYVRNNTIRFFDPNGLTTLARAQCGIVNGGKTVGGGYMNCRIRTECRGGSQQVAMYEATFAGGTYGDNVVSAIWTYYDLEFYDISQLNGNVSMVSATVAAGVGFTYGNACFGRVCVNNSANPVMGIGYGPTLPGLEATLDAFFGAGSITIIGDVNCSNEETELILAPEMP